MEVDDPGACLGVVIGPIVMGWRGYPWISLPPAVAATIIIHPVMDRDLPNLIGADMLRFPRTYIAIVLCAVAQLLAMPKIRDFLARFLSPR
jgi:hypothetical protein